MEKYVEHLLVQTDRSVYKHLERLSTEKQLPIHELINRFITLGLIEEKKGPFYFEEGSKRVRINIYAPGKDRE